MFENIYNFMNLFILNLMMKTKKFCKMTCSVKLGMHVAEVDNWSNSYKLPFKLNLINQISKVLMLKKTDLVDPLLRKEICPDLKVSFLAKILSNYQPDSMDPNVVPKDVIQKICTKEPEIVDEFMRTDTSPYLSKPINVRNWRENIEIPNGLLDKEEFKYLFN
jgi:hypothetical protein